MKKQHSRIASPITVRYQAVVVDGRFYDEKVKPDVDSLVSRSGNAA